MHVPDKASIPVVILCGGQGTRLREETERVPKPLVEIGSQPILWHIMKIYGHYGFRRFVLCLGYKGSMIKQYFLRYREQLSDFTVALKGDHAPRFHDGRGDEDWEVTCVDTGPFTQTGARLKLIEKYIDTPTFMFTYGDGVGDVDVDRLLTFHRDQGRIGTVTAVHPTSRYGEIRVEGPHAVEFNEKPTQAEGHVSGGFFVFERAFFNYLSEDPKLLLETEPLQKLARDDQLSVYRHHGFWEGMDTYREFTALNEMWLEDRAPWKVW